MGATATREDVARLFGRAAFGARAADLDTWIGRPYQDAVDHLLDVPQPPLRAPLPDDARRIALEEAGRYSQVPVRQARLSLEQAQRWWLERMRTTPYPLEERMVLFWHDHFATGPGQVFPDAGMLLRQNETLRGHSLGSFRALCEAITIDPAMLYWLNGVESTARRPNENYAREFFELFTLGTLPQIYTEQDVRESARALTGWVVDPLLRIPQFNASRHDTRAKTVLGRIITNQGSREYLEIVDVALDQDVAPVFVAYKLVTSLAYAPSGTGDALVQKVADALRASDWNIAAGVRALLLADEFRYADASSARQTIRQPIDLVVSACRAIGVSADSAVTLGVLRRMGQEPFDPPNVGGWPVGREWLSPVTTLARYDWGVFCFDLWEATPAPVRAALPPSGDLDAWTARFGLAALTENTRAAIVDYLVARAGASEAERQEGVLTLIASSPDWMVM